MMPPRQPSPGSGATTTPPPPTPPPPPVSPTTNKTTSSSTAGRVARLHFSCRAAIPMGSSLRVSTTLDTTAGNNGSSSGDVQSMYQNSIEMITTPELYPVFKTNRPVIVVLHHPSHRKNVQHHYYRYLVVSPAVDMVNAASEDPSRQYSTMVHTTYGYPGIVQFENPFPSTTSTSSTTGTPTAMASKSGSAVSLASSVGRNSSEPQASHHNTFSATTTTTASLPYRMVDIRIDTADVAESIDDVWDNPDDVTFQPFRIRDAVRC
jgi:hypothetical protein